MQSMCIMHKYAQIMHTIAFMIATEIAFVIAFRDCDVIALVARRRALRRALSLPPCSRRSSPRCQSRRRLAQLRVKPLSCARRALVRAPVCGGHRSGRVGEVHTSTRHDGHHTPHRISRTWLSRTLVLPLHTPTSEKQRAGVPVCSIQRACASGRC